MNLLFCINEAFLGVFANCLKSIVLHGGYGHYDVYVLHSCLENDVQAAMGRDFRQSVTFHFIRIPESLFAGFPESERYPCEIYYRLAAPLILPDSLSRILYLDADTVVINSLKELYETDFAGNGYVGCTHTRKFLTKVNQARLQSSKAEVYVNTGVLLLNLSVLRETIQMADIRDYVQKHAQSLLLPDQDILSALYGDQIKLVDPLRYNLSDRILSIYNTEHRHQKIDVPWIRQNGVIIHFCGSSKPWKEGYTGKLGIFYQELLTQ